MILDSIDKLVGSYFAAIASQPFTYKNVVYEPKPITVSPLIFREGHCPENCGACCIRCTLDFLPDDPKPQGCQQRLVNFHGRSVIIWTNFQEDNSSDRCEYLDPSNGRCGIYTSRPFLCDLPFVFTNISNENARLSTRVYGRSWALRRIDGDRGAKCFVTSPTKESVKEAHRKLLILDRWARYFSIETQMPQILRYVETGPHSYPLTLQQGIKNEQRRRVSLF